MRIPPAFAWPGGKTALMDKLLPLVGQPESYIEVFGGAGAVLLAKAPSKVEVWNDTKSEVVNFFRVAKHHLSALLDELAMLPNSREVFAELGQHPGTTDIQRAASWMFRMKNGFGGMGTNFGRARTGGGVAHSSMQSRLARIEAVSQRLQAVVIESLDYRKLIPIYDRPEAVFFCDPPYIVGDCRLYPPWNPDQMSELASTLQGISGRWIVTTCDCRDCRRIWSSHNIRQVSRRAGIENPRLRSKHFRELIITPRNRPAKPPKTPKSDPRQNLCIP